MLAGPSSPRHVPCFQARVAGVCSECTSRQHLSFSMLLDVAVEQPAAAASWTKPHADPTLCKASWFRLTHKHTNIQFRAMSLLLCGSIV